VNHNNNKNNKVVIMNNAPDLNKAPVVTNVSRTQKVNMVPQSRNDTKYDTTSTRSNISLAHETSAVSKSLISKYDATEKHVSTGIPINSFPVIRYLEVRVTAFSLTKSTR
jgi:hypothetical protein